MIKEIYFHRLEPNKIYYIKRLNNDFEDYTKSIGTFIKYYEVPGSLGYKVACFINISEFNTMRKNTYNYNFNRDTQFYEVKKCQIQQAMEDRALNLILKNITGDEYFEI
jgi:hypothetical protein